MIKDNQIYSSWYHGTKKEFAEDIAKGKIDVVKGGGEIGQGFYMGNYFDKAKQWAYHVNKKPSDKSKIVPKKAVVKFNIEPYISFRLERISWKRGMKIYDDLKNKAIQDKYTFDKDLLFSKVFGKPDYNFFQLKWESKNAQKLLNSNRVTRKIDNV
jgi:hypothetical protein